MYLGTSSVRMYTFCEFPESERFKDVSEGCTEVSKILVYVCWFRGEDMHKAQIVLTGPM